MTLNRPDHEGRQPPAHNGTYGLEETGHLLGVGGARSVTAGQIAWPSVVLMELEFTGQLWEYQGEAPWVFVTLPPDLADEIDEHVTERRGFGSVKVEVTIGESTWRTSIFPDKASGSFVLPIKREIRQAERLDPGDSTTVRIVIAPS